MSSFYNDTDAYCGQWLKNLIAAGHITAGKIDQRSIADVTPEDLMGYDRVHLFAGIAGWDYALRLAGWPAGVPVWTGSCPCQPFSCAGKGLGAADKRHLWPEMFRLIRECRPGVVFGEQVASAVGHGWLDGIFADLEGLGYACWATVAGAHSVGAPHIRQRLYWVAVAEGFGLQEPGSEPGCSPESSDRSGGLADASDDGHPAADGLRAEAEPPRPAWSERVGEPAGSGDTLRLADASDDGHPATKNGRDVGAGEDSRRVLQPEGVCGSGWNGGDRWWPCRDGKQRRISVEPEIFPLSSRVPGRVGQLRAAGNSIVPQLAEAFIETVMEVIQ